MMYVSLSYSYGRAGPRIVHLSSLKMSLFSAVFCGLLRSGKYEVAHPANLESLLIQIK